MGQRPGNGLAVSALVCGIVGAVLSFTLVGGLILGALAIVFGAIGRNRAKNDPQVPHGGLATAGLVLGILSLLITAVLWIWVLNEADETEDAIDEFNEQLNEDLETDFDTDFSTP
jgi:hypothetical protein